MFLKIKPPHHRGEGENKKVMQKKLKSIPGLFFPCNRRQDIFISREI